MELIKDIVRQCYPILVLSCCVLFVGYIFFNANLGEGEGVLEGTGKLYANALEESSTEYEGLGLIGAKKTELIKSVNYNADMKKIGDSRDLQSLFQIELCNNADMEQRNSTKVYLEDIKNQSGKSVLVRLSAEEIQSLEEIPAAFVYEKNSDRLYFFNSGVFLVQIKVYGIDGSLGRYEFQLPVEVS